MTAYRFLYRPPGGFGWLNLGGASFHDKESAGGLVADWNRRDRGKWQWKTELCEPTDYDHPNKGGMEAA